MNRLYTETTILCITDLYTEILRSLFWAKVHEGPSTGLWIKNGIPDQVGDDEWVGDLRFEELTVDDGAAESEFIGIFKVIAEAESAGK